MADVSPKAVGPPAVSRRSLRGHPASAPAWSGSGLRGRVNSFVTRVFSGVRILLAAPVLAGPSVAAASPGDEETADRPQLPS